jgi:hypothetical protein
LVEWLSIHEDGAEGLVVALEGLLGLEEEPAGVVPIHDAGSRMLIIVWPGTTAERPPKNRAEKGSRPPSPQVGLLKHRGKGARSIRTVMDLRV